MEYKNRTHTQVALIVLDGWGYREEYADNAIMAAHTPCFDELWNTYSHTTLAASGEAVGLPEGQMGNSEVGHMTIGAGKPIDTDLVRINKAIRDGKFSSYTELQELFLHTRTHNSTLHIMGLVSTGGVHSHRDHLYEIVKVAKEADVKHIMIHVFTDGRDVAPQSAGEYVLELEKELETIGVGKIASISGRFYAMDRDNNWDRVQKASDAILSGKGIVKEGKKASEIIVELYANDIIDEHIEPIVLGENGNIHSVQENDGILFFNFRPDRARMIAHVVAKHSEGKNIQFVTMTEYDAHIPATVLFEPLKIETTLAEVLSQNGYTQAHIAETEKYAHATYFLNGGVEKPYKGETHVLIESRKDIQTHNQAPEMRAFEIADATLDAIHKDIDFIFVNFANADMVGHTGDVPAIIKSVEAVDASLKRIVDTMRERGGIVLITADHGNAELNKDQETGVIHTAHTTNRVPCILMDSNKHVLKEGGGLADIAPTVLKLFGIQKPESMQGESLV